jgi:hypothetical protein
MDENVYQVWWRLHLRVALGEELPAEEQRVYEAGLAELEAEEQAQLRRDVTELRELQARLREMEARDRELAQQEATLRQQAAQLEQRYLALFGEPLGA